MADQLHDTTANAAIIPEIWSARFYEVLLAALPFIESVDRDYEGNIADLGDIVNISSVEEFDDAEELAEGARNDADATTISGQQLTINKRTVKDFIVTKTAQIQSLSHMDKLRERAVFAIQKRMQQVIIDTVAPSTSAPDHVISYDSGTTLALADALEAKELLDTANVPDSDRISIKGAAQWNDLFNITGFTSRDFIPAGSPLTSGAITTPILGFTPKLTTVVGNTSFWFHPTFLTLAIQQQLNIVSGGLDMQGIRAGRVNVDVLWGLKQLDNTRVVTIS